jgi:hypothetical protein
MSGTLMLHGCKTLITCSTLTYLSLNHYKYFAIKLMLIASKQNTVLCFVTACDEVQLCDLHHNLRTIMV